MKQLSTVSVYEWQGRSKLCIITGTTFITNVRSHSQSLLHKLTNWHSLFPSLNIIKRLIKWLWLEWTAIIWLIKQLFIFPLDYYSEVSNWSCSRRCHLVLCSQLSRSRRKFAIRLYAHFKPWENIKIPFLNILSPWKHPDLSKLCYLIFLSSLQNIKY